MGQRHKVISKNIPEKHLTEKFNTEVAASKLNFTQ